MHVCAKSARYAACAISACIFIKLLQLKLIEWNPFYNQFYIFTFNF